MKKRFSILLSVLLSISLLFPLTSCEGSKTAPDISKTNTDPVGIENAESPVEDFEYEISSEGDAVYITKYIGTSKQVVIPEKINELPVVSLKGVFEEIDGYNVLKEGVFENSEIESVTIPSSLTAIGISAFRNCKNLVAFRFAPDSRLDRVLDGAFRNCVKLKSVDFSQTKLLTIGNSAFEGCTDLSEVKFSKTLTEICSKAFYDCSALLEIDLPEELVEVEPNTFVNCLALKSITIPQKLDLFQNAFPGIYNVPSLEKIIFKEGRKEIIGYAFFDTTSDVEIRIPKSIQKFSPAPFFTHGTSKIIFEGNCPEIIEAKDFYGNSTIYYDPSTSGWDECDWQETYGITVKPLEER